MFKSSYVTHFILKRYDKKNKILLNIAGSHTNHFLLLEKVYIYTLYISVYIYTHINYDFVKKIGNKIGEMLKKMVM